MPEENGSGKEQQQDQQVEKTFTQEEVDRIVQERLARAKPKKPADYDDLKAKAARLDEIEAEQATEQEKAVKAAVEEATREVTQRLMTERVMDKIEVAAAGEFEDVEDARLRLGSRADEFLTDDGEIDTDAIAEAVQKLLEDKPHLRKKSGDERPPSRKEVGLGTRGGGSGDENVRPGAGRLALAYANKDD